jgi:hypothetical protein
VPDLTLQVRYLAAARKKLDRLNVIWFIFSRESGSEMEGSRIQVVGKP